MGVAIVTGGTRGIGLAISKALIAEGHKVAAIYHGNEEAAESFRKETGGAAYKFDAVQHFGFYVRGHIRFDIAWTNCIDGDALGCGFKRQRLRKTNQAGLGRGIIDLPKLPLLAIDAADINDASKIALPHAVNDQAAHIEAGRQIRLDHIMPVFRVHFMQHAIARDPGIVN